MIRVAVAVGAAVAVLIALVLAYAATAEARFDPASAILLALAVVWIGQVLVALSRRIR
ncbi:hypothetical protein [Phytohabitans aurantiacus]|uniref:Uncharacterized protein n=1 Tax=Phytohabitans aurantiacus TaxID=3016789 RepID=A0ABQ5QS92_9ACTN|nr:hypothetical protein [Phytohabitans aurantiacus]GLH97368.1 hypothetical protein Pa4123_26430 [Phytohabitans aurantiacus]